MKKYYASAVALAAVLSASAQQLPNADFEGEWVDSKPWNSVYTGLSMSEALKMMGQEVDVKQPQGWIVSNVLGVVTPTDEGKYGALGSTIVGTKVDGNNSESAIKLTNNPNPFMATQIVPAYISLGTTWATNTLDFLTFSPQNKDGGVFGGLDFTMRPDALIFDYKLEAPEEGEGQKATVLVYAWKGSWSQAEVPGNNSMSSETVKTTMTDRDRNILGMECAQGGEITKTDDAELIAKSLEYITEFTSEWKSYTLPINYLTASAPAKINVVLSANDFFDSENIVKGNSMSVDNIKLAYYSRLKSLEIGGEAVKGFDSDTYEYTLDIEMPEESSFVCQPMANAYSAKTEIALDKANATATIKVSNLNEGGLDIDGKASHEYVIKFKQASGVTSSYGGIYVGTVSIDMGAPLEVPGNVHITPDAADPSKCTFMLPNFSLGQGAELGDIVVPDVTVTESAEGHVFAGSVKGLKLNMNGTEIVANVTLDGNVTPDGVATMNIPVIWITDPANDPEGTATGIKIDVKFNGKFQTSAIENVETTPSDAPVEFYSINGVRIASDRLTPGIYIKRQGNKVEKVYVK